MLTFIAIAILIGVYLYRYYVDLIFKYPRGPLPLPFFGNILQVNHENPALALQTWGKQFNGVFTVCLLIY